MMDGGRLEIEKFTLASSIKKKRSICMAWRITVESIKIHIPSSWILSKPLVDGFSSKQKRTAWSYRTLRIVYNLELEEVVGRDTIVIEEKAAVYFLYWGRPPRLRFNMALKPSKSLALYKPSKLVDRRWLNA